MRCILITTNRRGLEAVQTSSAYETDALYSCTELSLLPNTLTFTDKKQAIYEARSANNTWLDSVVSKYE